MSNKSEGIDPEYQRMKRMEIWFDAVNAKTMSFDRCVELAPLRALLVEHHKTQSNGGCLHIITEDGNYEDDHVQWCIDYIESGEWRKVHSEWVTEDDAVNQLKIAKMLLNLTEWEREMVDNGTTMNEDVFNCVMNGDPSGLLER